MEDIPPLTLAPSLDICALPSATTAMVTATSVASVVLASGWKGTVEGGRTLVTGGAR